jgi:NifB/MoaA-like Fe-S oxidoreductase
MVQDLACVPTGITKYREGLYPIADVDGEYSKKLLDTVDKLNAEFGVPFLLPADEYFVKAGREFKDAAFYGDFEQIENGIGLTSKFLLEANAALEGLAQKNGGRYALKKEKRALLISGVSAEAVNNRILRECEKTIAGLTATTLAVKNRFFGETVTCTGLLTGQDILAAVREFRAQGGCFDEIVLPGNTMKEFEDVFLCGMTLDGLKKELGFENIRINREGGYGLVEILSKEK